VAGLYDANEGLASLYINNQVVASSSISIGPLETSSQRLLVATGSFHSAGTSITRPYSGSIDEVRIAHTASHLWHVKNYSRPIDSEDYLKLRYSFNEGTIGTGSVDELVVDYSKTGLHGKYLNYTVDFSRVSGSTMALDLGDPILYSNHSRIAAFTGTQEFSASLFDNTNNNQIFNMIPETVLREDDNVDGLYRSFLLGMSRFFDELKLYIDQFINLRITNYDGYNDTPDQFLPMLQRYFGWKVTEHFGDANPLALFFGEDVLSSGSLDIPLVDIKNQFWRRILNNLPYLLKTKGKRHNLDAFFNVLGINRENITLKEYGYLPGSSIQDTRIHKEKVVSLLGIGTGSVGDLSSSFAKVTASLLTTGFTDFTVETLAQLPFVSASYSGSITTGSIWQFTDPQMVTGSFTLLWNVPYIGSTSGRFILTSSDGQELTSSLVEVFDGDFVHIAAGLDLNQLPFIEVRTIDNDEIDLYESVSGVTAFSGVFTGSKLDFVMGANSGTFFEHKTQGFFGEYRIWNTPLSSSDLDAHALHFENVGIEDPNEEPHPLLGHWALNEGLSSDANGDVGPITDLSRNERTAYGERFPASTNPYDKFLLEYNYLSPSIDLKWSENKVRIRNKTELTIDDVATDTNEVSLEFNLVESLNEDITKIFSTFDILNDIIGQPVNKYRDEYSDLESVRREYFERLGDSIHFTQFFKLFKWFDRKLSDSIKQLLPARVKFVGGEQVVESHMLERPRYGYKYPVFRTPQDVPEAALRGTYPESLRDADPLFKGYSSASYGLSSDPGDSVVASDGERMITIPNSPPADILSTYRRSFLEDESGVKDPISIVYPYANKLEQSSDYGTWSKTNCTIDTGYSGATHPVTGEGGFTPQRLKESVTATALVRISSGNPVRVYNGQWYVFSCYVHHNVRSWCYIRTQAYDGTFRYNWFNITGNSLGTMSAGFTGSIEETGNGSWKRVSVKFRRAEAGSRDASFQVGPTTGNGVQSYSTSINSLAIWVHGAQAEELIAPALGGTEFSYPGSPGPKPLLETSGAALSGSLLSHVIYSPQPSGSIVVPSAVSIDSLKLAGSPVSTFRDGVNEKLLPGLVKEGVNLVFPSQDASDSNQWPRWDATAVTISADQYEAPDGTFTGDFILETTNTARRHGIRGDLTNNSIETTTGKWYVASAYVVPGVVGGRTWAYIEVDSSHRAWFDLQNNVPGTSTGVYGHIETAPGGWKRISIAWQEGTGTTRRFGVLGATSNGATSYNGAAGLLSIVVWGMQFEEYDTEMTKPGPYIYTLNRSVRWFRPPTFSKTSGDSQIDSHDPNSGVNFRNEYAKEVIMKKDRDNE
jgi:hypothetical protein